MNRHITNRARAAALALAAAGLLGACGGGDDGPSAPSPTTSVPASASESPSGFIDYLRQLVAYMDDTIEPVDTSAVVGPADDTGEPVSVF